MYIHCPRCKKETLHYKALRTWFFLKEHMAYCSSCTYKVKSLSGIRMLKKWQSHYPSTQRIFEN